MSDFISRQDAIELMCRALEDNWESDYAADRMNELPSAEPERKKGKWSRPSRPKTYERYCSVCGRKAWYCGTDDYDFCPNCGADMRGKENEKKN